MTLIQQVLAGLKNRVVVLLLIILALLLVWDFATRVFSPVTSQEPAELQPQDEDRLSQDDLDALPEYLAAWLAPDSAQQDAESAEADSEGAAREALAGSEELGAIRLRLRAIFINRLASGDMQAFGIAEQQFVESGDVSRVVLRQGEQVEGHLVTNIESNFVDVQVADSERIVRLHVFSPHRAEQESERLLEAELEAESGNNDNK